MSVSLNRRTVLQSGALAAGALAAGGLWLAPLHAGAPGTAAAQQIPITGRRIGWLRIDPGRPALLSLVEFGPAGPVREIASTSLADGSVDAITREAMEVAAVSVARSWGIPRREVR